MRQKLQAVIRTILCIKATYTGNIVLMFYKQISRYNFYLKLYFFCFIMLSEQFMPSETSGVLHVLCTSVICIAHLKGGLKGHEKN